MSKDYSWMSNGGLLLDGNGDIAFTKSDMDTIISMIRTRLKSAVDGWKLYRIGAGLDGFLGNTSDAEAEIAIQRQVIGALSRNYIPAGLLDVQTLRFGNEIQVYVFVTNQLVAQATVSIQAGQ